MLPKLTEEQVQSLNSKPHVPARVVDARTNTVYVLLRADLYERVRALVEEDFDLSETYPAQMEAAMRAGWSDPAMDDYNNYDENRKKLCP